MNQGNTRTPSGQPEAGPVDVRRAALDALKAGKSVHPPREDGSKAPEGAWKEHQEHLPTLDDLHRWYGTKGPPKRTGLGIVQGRVSGNLETFEFDAAGEVYEPFKEAAAALGYGDVVERIEAGYLECSPSGGVHWPYHCETIEGNTELARRYKTEAEFTASDRKAVEEARAKGKEHKPVMILIETRGQGGYVVVAPSSGKVHPSGKSYLLARGGFATIATITPGERKALWDLARTFNLIPEPDRPDPAETEARKSHPRDQGDTLTPWDDYNARTEWRDVLTGWTLVHTQGETEYWRRPGKDDGWSATVNRNGSDRLYVFSTSTEFEPETPYTKFGAYARLEHHDDIKAATRALYEDGYGTRRAANGKATGGYRYDGGNGKHTGEPPPEAPPFTLGLIDSAAFFSQEHPVEWLIKGVTVAKEPAVIGGPSKALKTSILIDKVISLATATSFLGRFDVPAPRRVALLSGESGKRVIQSSARRVCESRGLTAADLGNVHWGFTLPQLTNRMHLLVLRKTVEDLGLEYLAIDPFYLTLMAGNAGVDPKNMFEMGPLLYDVANVCTEAGCTPELAHHFTKKREDPFGAPDLSELAYAGIGQFVRQWTLIAPRERFDAEIGLFKLHFAYGGSAGHCGEFAVDIEVGKLDPDLDRRCWKVSIATPSETRNARQEQHQADAEAKRKQKEQDAAIRKMNKEREDQCTVLAVFRKSKIGMTANQVRLATGLDFYETGRALYLLTESGSVRPTQVTVKSGKGRVSTYDGFELTPEQEEA